MKVSFNSRVYGHVEVTLVGTHRVAVGELICMSATTEPPNLPKSMQDVEDVTKEGSFNLSVEINEVDTEVLVSFGSPTQNIFRLSRLLSFLKSYKKAGMLVFICTTIAALDKQIY